MVKRLRTRLENLFFPPKCIFCGKLLPPTTKREEAVCTECEKKLPYCVDVLKCKSCHRPIPEGVYCDACRKHPQKPYERLTAAYLYRDRVKRSIARFKRERYQSYGAVYARHLCAVISYECKDLTFDLVLPVPARKARLHTEGYNQAASLARMVAKEMGIPYGGELLRQKEERQKQSELTAVQRWLNTQDNILVTGQKKIQGKTILLIDDVCTTGATMFACALALRLAGAKAVYCVAAATAEKE